MESKIALCFLTYGNLSKPKLWKDFLNSKYNVYIHNKNKFTGEFEKYCIKNKIKTAWGKISLVKATINLFKDAFENKENQYFILLSDTCIPLYSANEIYNKITEIDNNIITSFLPKKGGYDDFPRWNYAYRDRILRGVKDFIDKEKLVKQNQWMLLKRDTVEFFIKNDYTNLFNMGVPDEYYFINIIHKFNISFVNKSITYINKKKWKHQKYSKVTRKGSPNTYNILTNEIIEEILESGNLFMRKVSPNCELSTYFDTIKYDNSV